MLSAFVAALGLLAWAVPVPAQDQSQDCAFALISDDSMLGQLPGGQVLGISTTQNNSAVIGGILFRLKEGRLYDTEMRACWWVAPTTVLVCNLYPPAFPDPLFSLDEETHLVWNNSQSDFWECPVYLGSEAGVQGATSYYLDLPPEMETGGGCRKVKVEARLFGGWFCEGGGEGSFSTGESASSSAETTTLSSGDATVTVSWTELSLSGSWIAVTETVWETVDAAPTTVSQTGAFTTFTTVTVGAGWGPGTTEAVS